MRQNRCSKIYIPHCGQCISCFPILYYLTNITNSDLLFRFLLPSYGCEFGVIEERQVSSKLRNRILGFDSFEKRRIVNQPICQPNTIQKMSCTNCKIQSQHLKDKCPYAECWRCGAKGHRYSKYCPQYGKTETEVEGSKGDDSQKPKLTRRQSSYIFIAYTIARFTNVGPSSTGSSSSK